MHNFLPIGEKIDQYSNVVAFSSILQNLHFVNVDCKYRGRLGRDCILLLNVNRFS